MLAVSTDDGNDASVWVRDVAGASAIRVSRPAGGTDSGVVRGRPPDRVSVEPRKKPRDFFTGGRRQRRARAPDNA